MEVSSELTQEKQGSGATAQREELKDALGRLLNRELKRITCSNPNGSSDFIKLTVRPVEIRGRLLFQVEEFTDKQAFQKNLERDVAAGYVAGQIGTLYRNAEGFSGTASLHVMVSKKGKMTMKMRGISGEQAAGAPAKRPEPARIGAPGHEAAGRSRRGRLGESLPQPQPEPELYSAGGRTGCVSGGFGRHDAGRQSGKGEIR